MNYLQKTFISLTSLCFLAGCSGYLNVDRLTSDAHVNDILIENKNDISVLEGTYYTIDKDGQQLGVIFFQSAQKRDDGFICANYLAFRAGKWPDPYSSSQRRQTCTLA